MSVGGELEGEDSMTCRAPVVPANEPVPAVTVSVNMRLTWLGGLLSVSDPEAVPLSVPAFVVVIMKLPVKGAGSRLPTQPAMLRSIPATEDPPG
jgi:hypothetical protein